LRNLPSAVSSPFFTFSTTVLNAKPSLGERDAEVVEPCGQLLLFRRVGFAQFGATRSITVVANVGLLHAAEPVLYLKPLSREALSHFFHPAGRLYDGSTQGVDAAFSGAQLGDG
jgi:hypothetical protein